MTIPLSKEDAVNRTDSLRAAIREYDYIFDKMAGESWFIFMNHGFAPESTPLEFPALSLEDDRWRHQIFLYFYLLRAGLAILQSTSSSGYDLLDIGCGRG